MDGFPDRHPGAWFAIGRRQCAPVPGGRAPGPSRAGFLYIKSGASWSRRQWRSSSLEPSLLSLLRPGQRARSQLHRELGGLPAGTMRGFELPLLLLALVLCQAPRGPAAPVSAGTGGGTVLAKMYPRGSHWAVGHLMGKKSTDEFPSLYESEGDGLKEQLREYIRWEEAARNLLGLLEAVGNRSHQPPQHQPTWDSEDGSYSKDVPNAKMVDSLLQVLKGKEGTSS
ncbi:gastrin-releasing peptide isoform X1 [Peromyscus californicus insignis]|uniref:gastrin-releasing peptide isoform X1 n=1 Tax=Peromyscus californicus insignis TaxID=564181 RepID=UPI0022A7889F|nr:gastrin-releasing peptide isoform X1 [Peromyscus californicus insignis]